MCFLWLGHRRRRKDGKIHNLLDPSVNINCFLWKDHSAGYGQLLLGKHCAAILQLFRIAHREMGEDIRVPRSIMSALYSARAHTSFPRSANRLEENADTVFFGNG